MLGAGGILALQMLARLHTLVVLAALITMVGAAAVAVLLVMQVVVGMVETV